MEVYGLISFQTTSQVVSSEDVLEDAGIPCRLIPLPPEIDTGCGLVCKVSLEDLDGAAKVIKEASIPYLGLYQVTLDEGVREVVKR